MKATEAPAKKRQTAHHSPTNDTDRSRLQEMLSQAPAAIGVVRGPGHVFELANPLYLQLVGRTAAIIGRPVRDVFPELEGQGFFELLDNVYKTGQSFVGNEMPIKLDKAGDGKLVENYLNFVYQPLKDAKGRVEGIMAHAVNVTEQVLSRQRVVDLAEDLGTERDKLRQEISKRQRSEFLLERQKHILELIAQGSPLPETLEELVRTVEQQSDDGMLGSILLLDDSGQRLQHGAAPSLPAAYNRAIDGISIGQGVGSCGTAAFSGKQVIVSDIATDPIWKDFKTLAGRHKLAACWSTPIMSASQRILGTFAVYYRQSRMPSPQDLELVAMVSRTAAIAINAMQTKEKLQEQADRLRFMAESMPQKIFTATPNGGIDYFNPQWMEFTGLKFKQIKDWGWTQFIHPDDVDENVRRWKHSIKTGEPFEIEHRFRHADGSYHWHISRAHAMRDEQGKVIMWVGSNTDINDNKRSEVALQRVQAQLQTALAAGSIGTWVWDIPGDKVVADKYLAFLFGINTAKAAAGLPLEVFVNAIHPDDRQRAQELIGKAVETGGEYEADYRVVGTDGTVYWVVARGRVEYAADGTPARFPGVLVDITARKKAEENLSYRTALLEAQNETTPDGILIVDAKGKMLSYNKRFAEMWRIPKKIMKAKDDTAALNFAMTQLADPEGFIDRVTYLYAHPEEVSHEEIQFTDGRTFDRYGAPVKHGGHAYGWAWHFRDLTEERKAQKALRESEQHFRATFDQAAVGMAHVALDGNWIRVNQKLCDILGYTADELLAERFQNLTHPDDLAASLAAIESITSGKVSSHTFEKRYLQKDGTVVWTNLTIAPSRGRTGRIKHFITVIEDITARQQAEESLRRQSKVLESMAEGVSVTDQEGIIVFTNPAEDAMFGYKPGELVGQHVSVQNAYPPKANKRIVDEVIEQLKSKGSWVGEWQNRRKDSTPFQTSARISAIQLDGKQYWICVQEDITKRKRAEIALRESEERFRQLADSMPQMVWTARPDGYLDYYNKQWYDYTGFPEGYGDQSWEPILHPDDVQPCFDAWYESVRTGQPYHIEYRFRDPDNPGNYRWFLGKALPVKDKNGKIIKWFGTCTETHEVKEALKSRLELEVIAANLTKQQARLLAINNAKDEFISLASHQLRTPASGVKQYIGMLLEGYAGDLTPGQSEMLQVAHESNERQLKIIDDLLKVAHVDAGKVRLQKSDYDLGKMIAEVISEQQSTFQKRQQQAVFKQPSKPVWANVDIRLMRMVLENLTDNASKYSIAGKPIAVTLKQTKQTISISIKDRGVGIAAKDQKKLFQKFSRIDNPLSTSVDSTGLGLYWAKKIVDLHKGTIAVTSKINQGSTFTIKLPTTD